ncbi:uncharacterized protein [Clytia hemisphaerica]|uniref:Uncharacterized protein n=1 Tax=Clytia hemisphaerica TaxID=252671 RepID=A0A7M5TVD6_9CNID
MAVIENKPKAFLLLLICSIPFWAYVFLTWQGSFINTLEIKGKVNVLVKLQNAIMDSRVYRKPRIKPMLEPVRFLHNNTCQYRSYERLMKPCHNTSWENGNKNMTLRTKADLTEIKIELPNSTDQPGRVILQTFDELKNRKKIGGDFWRSYISNDKFKKAIYFVDHLNGSYSAEFVIPFKGTYTLNVFLEHSVCDGIIDPPMWWFTKGNVHGNEQKEGIIGKMDQFRNTPTKKVTIEIKIEPSSKLKQTFNSLGKVQNVINEYFGYWKDGEYTSYQDGKPIRTPTLNDSVSKPLNTLWFYGDSLTYLFQKSCKKHPLCTKVFQNCELTYTWTYKKFYSTNDDNAKDFYTKSGKDFDEAKFVNDFKGVLMGDKMTNSNSVFVVNWGMHTIGNMQLPRKMKAFQRFLKMIQEVKDTLKDRMPLVIWKSTTPPTFENIKQTYTSMRFRTKYRAEVWNSYTIRELCKANIPVLDVYDMALSTPIKPKDHVHFPDKAFYPAQDDLLKYIIKVYGLDK